MSAGFQNNMTLLLNKIERRLGTKPLNLPEHLQKNKWAEVIEEDSLVTFSRYYPYEFKYELSDKDKKGDTYYLDEDLIGGLQILGIRDISWEDFGSDSLALQQNAGYGIYDFLGANYGLADIGLMQMRADHMSLFNNGIYPIFDPPNKIKLVSAVGNDVGKSVGKFHIYIHVQHNKNLTTISPTQMETFESLAQADVAKFLYEGLKYYDGLQTVYATIDLKLASLEQEASKRDDVINYIKESYVSASNQNQPMILCV